MTNSIPIVRRFSEFVERRGWSDGEGPVRVLICSGLLRETTQAVAEPSTGANVTRDSIDALVKLGGIDACFVGCNGFHAEGGLTMPTGVELPTKQQFMAAAKRPLVVADSSKAGVRHPIVIAKWDERFELLTNRPEANNSAMDAILAVAEPGKVRFAEDHE